MKQPDAKTVVVVGSGVAALLAALKFCDQGLQCQLVSPVSLRHAIGSVDPQSLLSPSQDLVNLLLRLGVPFECTAEGFLKQSKGPSGTVYHIAGNARTQIHRVLFSQILYQKSLGRIEVLDSWRFLDFLKNQGGEVCGVQLQSVHSQELRSLNAHAVVMACGGYESLFGCHSLRPQSSCLEWSKVVDLGVSWIAPECFGIEDHCVSLGHKLSLSFGDQLQSLKKGVASSLGGVWSQPNGKTEQAGLYVIGPMSYRIARTDCEKLSAELQSALDLHVTSWISGAQAVGSQENGDNELDLSGPENPWQLHDDLAELLFEKLVQNPDATSCGQALARLEVLKYRAERVHIVDTARFANQGVPVVRELQAKLKLARLVAYSALCRYKAAVPQEKITRLRFDARTQDARVAFVDTLNAVQEGELCQSA